MQMDHNNIVIKCLYFFKLVPTTMHRYYIYVYEWLLILKTFLEGYCDYIACKNIIESAHRTVTENS